ncbi:MAG: hypothetical protein QF464_17040, partial [Myxococcota bacterium]|nr:hypothetical protein [Myxococcota bacterium]
MGTRLGAVAIALLLIACPGGGAEPAPDVVDVLVEDSGPADVSTSDSDAEPDLVETVDAPPGDAEVEPDAPSPPSYPDRSFVH